MKNKHKVNVAAPDPFPAPPAKVRVVDSENTANGIGPSWRDVELRISIFSHKKIVEGLLAELEFRDRELAHKERVHKWETDSAQQERNRLRDYYNTVRDDLEMANKRADGLAEELAELKKRKHR